MDLLHMKAGADVKVASAMTEDEFYESHSCDWFHFFRSNMRRALAFADLNSLHINLRAKLSGSS